MQSEAGTSFPPLVRHAMHSGAPCCAIPPPLAKAKCLERPLTELAADGKVLRCRRSVGLSSNLPPLIRLVGGTVQEGPRTLIDLVLFVRICIAQIMYELPLLNDAR